MFSGHALMLRSLFHPKAATCARIDADCRFVAVGKSESLMSGSMPFWRVAAMLLLPAPVWAQSQIGELFVSEPGAPTAVRPAGTGLSVVNGSHLPAARALATLRLARGGQVRLCASTNLSVNAAGQGQGMMLGMGVGALEIDYRLSQGATDFLVTPDFNLRLAGPGTYHFAVGVN